MKAKQLREMTQDGLEQDGGSGCLDLGATVTEKLEDSKAIINTRRDVARIKTLLRERRK